jgi:hypothetical protein
VLERRLDIGLEETNGSCLFDIVVRMKRSSLSEMRSKSRSRKSVIEVVAGRGRDRVDGRCNPGKDVSRTLIVEEAMLCRF